MLDVEITTSGRAKRGKMGWFDLGKTKAEVKTGEDLPAGLRPDIDLPPESVGVIAEEEKSSFNVRPIRERENVMETAYGRVDQVFEDKVNIVLDLYGQKKVYGFPLEALRRCGLNTLEQNDTVMLKAIFSNGRVEGRLIRVGAIPETPVGKKRFIVDKQYFLKQDV
ncbi:MAG TPA: hypothetical protein ENI13_00670 [candidate division CPR3 bacterium]|uniref:Uncharacterized protein n=1 Tax=candidate division CPR3 bacterium TaxID=2268181 RepID=A0A7C1SPP6_UNCC3|nr:hypothetical protein [candidate division CPR3 bacterium]